jgi:hypothetical protein
MLVRQVRAEKVIMVMVVRKPCLSWIIPRNQAVLVVVTVLAVQGLSVQEPVPWWW